MDNGFLRDNEGNRSSMRLMSIISLLAAIWFGWITLKIGERGAASDTGIYITLSFLLSAFAPKTLQKFIELKAAK